MVIINKVESVLDKIVVLGCCIVISVVIIKVLLLIWYMMSNKDYIIVWFCYELN